MATLKKIPLTEERPFLITGFLETRRSDMCHCAKEVGHGRVYYNYFALSSLLIYIKLNVDYCRLFLVERSVSYNKYGFLAVTYSSPNLLISLINQSKWRETILYFPVTGEESINIL